MIKLYFLISGLLLCQIFPASAQWMDDFSDDNFSLNPLWHGDTSDFIIQDEVARLVSSEAGTSRIFTSVLMEDPTIIEWTFDIELDFAPSNNNKLKVVLFSSDSLFWNVEGENESAIYYLNFGENGAADAVELWLRNPGSEFAELLCRGQDSLVSTSFHRKYKVHYFDATWQILSAEATSPYYQLEATAQYEADLSEQGYFAMFLNYTSSNTDAFYFDNIYAGSYEADTLAPEIIEVEVLNENQLVLTFNEPLDSSVLSSTNFEIIESASEATELAFGSSLQKEVLLSFVGDFPPWNIQTLHIESLMDLEGNTADNLNIEFVYAPIYEAQAGELRFSEIMPDPSPPVGLPNAEYIELFNSSDSLINIASYAIKNSGNIIYLNDFELYPDSFLILCKAIDLPLFESDGSVMGLNNWQTLLNSGDSLELFNRSGQLLDKLYYLNSWYDDPLKAEGGWSLERIDAGLDCFSKFNWNESISMQGGTPGKENSVALMEIENEISILQAYPIDSSRVQLDIEGELDTSQISSIESSSEPFFSIDWDGAIVNENGIQFECFPKLDKGVLYHLNIDKLIACHQVEFYPEEILFSFPEKAKPGDIVINELLFNAYTGANDFIEIYNRSAYFIDLMKWRILELENGLITEDAAISSDRLLIAPNEILAFSKEKEELPFYYQKVNEKQVRTIPDLPNFPDEEAVVQLLSEDFVVIDSLHYNASMHFSLLEDQNGVSLERIHPDRPSNDASTWVSAAESVDFATPGYQNSHYWNGAESKAKIEVEPLVFTPNNDGERDLLHIHFNLNEGGWQSNIRIYNDRGMIVKELRSNYWIESRGSVEWDGMANNNELASVGIYIVYFEIFNSKGEQFAFKKVCVLGNSY
jgi:hypothetical protein